MAADNPYAELNEARAQAKDHAEEGRRWATDADRAESRGDADGARTCAAISQAHSLAAIATAAGGGGILSIEDLGR
jgi:hypothetical protein